MFIDSDLTIEETMDYYIYKYSKTTNKEEKILILELIKQLNKQKEIENEL